MTLSFDSLDLVAEDRDLPGVTDVPVLFHVGPHKTGSTWLQRRFFPALDGIVYSGDPTLTHSAFLMPSHGAFSLRATQEFLAPLLKEARRSDRPLVLSDEALAGRAFGQKYFREVTALRIRRAFPKAKLLVISRRQDQMLGSLYSEYLRYGYSSTLAAFLDQDTGNSNIHPLLDMNFYEWDRALRFYRSVFGAGQVTMLPMEQVVGDGSRMARALSDMFGVTIDSPPTQEMRVRERPALSGWSMTALRLCNRLVAQDSRYRSRLRRLRPTSIAWQVDRFTPAWARRRDAAAQTERIRDLLGNRFAASNARYRDMISVDLGALGYVL